MLEFERQKLELLYDSKIVALYKDYLKTPKGNIVEYDLIKHKSKGGAGILLVDDNEDVYLVKQYRNSINRVDIEIPAGGYSYDGEAGSICAVREAEEETGFVPQNIVHVTEIVSSIGTFDEKTDIYIGTDLKRGTIKYDPDEFIEVIKMGFEDALNKIYTGEIIDSKTIIALLAYKDLRDRKKL